MKLAIRDVMIETYQAAKFAVVGLIATVIHILVAWIFIKYFRINPFVSNIFAFTTAFFVSFISHYTWVFKAKRSKHSALKRFLLVAIFGFTVNNVVLIALLRIGIADPFNSIFISALFVPAVSYILNRNWTFK